MKPETVDKIQYYTKATLESLGRGFDIVADWVTALSWWRFLLISIGSLICAAILQNTVFSTKVEETIVSQPTKKKKILPPPKSGFECPYR
jgi:delta 1-pyrroline-5-carboxylate dehydrogenase